MATSSSTDFHPFVRQQVDTEFERCFRRVESEKDGERIRALLSDLFLKQTLTPDEIDYTRPEVLKKLTIKALDLDITPSIDLEWRNLVWNIKNIWAELIQRKIPMEEDETLLISDFLECYYQDSSHTPPTRSPSSIDFKVYEESAVVHRIDPREAPSLLKQHPIQWLFRVLNPQTGLSDAHHWKDFINPQVLVLSYRSYMSTEDLLDNIHAALEDSDFSEREQIKLQFRLIDLLGTWYRSRYFIHELSQEPIKIRFRKIFSILSQITHPDIRREVDILKVLHDRCLVITPRNRNSISLSHIDQLLKAIINAKRRSTFETECKNLVNEITAYFVEILLEIPVEEYFKDLTKMDSRETPHFKDFANAFNNIDEWLCQKLNVFLDKNRVKLYEALVYSMNYARTERLYQTALTLKLVFEKLTAKEIIIRLPSGAIAQYKEIEKLFDMSINLKNLRSVYRHNDDNSLKYLPAIPYLTHDLTFILQKQSTEVLGELTILSISRLNQIFKTLYPLLNFRKNNGLYIPKTNIRFMIAQAFAQAESSSSNAPDPTASK